MAPKKAVLASHSPHVRLHRDPWSQLFSLSHEVTREVTPVTLPDDTSSIELMFTEEGAGVLEITPEGAESYFVPVDSILARGLYVDRAGKFYVQDDCEPK